MSGHYDYPRFKVAAVQAGSIFRDAPQWFDLEATLEKAIGLIDEAGREGGALGGKLLGAGGGGFMLFFVPPELRHKVREKLAKLLYVPFTFESLGSQIIYYAPEVNY